MRRSAAVAYSFLVLAIGSDAEVAPVRKVVQLMQAILEKGQAEKHAEQVQFAAQKRFCRETLVEKQHTIAEAQQTCTTLNLSIQKHAADAAVLTREISELSGDIFTWNGEIQSASSVREVEKTDHDATCESYEETHDALQRAIAALKEIAHTRAVAHEPEITIEGEVIIEEESNHTELPDKHNALPLAVAALQKATRDQRNSLGFYATTTTEPSWKKFTGKLVPGHKQSKASWAQVMKSLIPDSARRAIDVFLEQGESESEDLGSIWHKLVQQGKHDAEFHSHDVIELLQRLSDKFGDQRISLKKEENDSQHTYDMLVDDLKAQIAQAATDRSQKAESKTRKLQAIADARGDLHDATAAMHEDQKYVSDLTTTCEQTASAFEARQKLRGEEIIAVEQAIDIISGSAVAGNAEKHMSTLSTKGSSFASLRSAPPTRDTQQHVVNYLQARAKKLNSRVLASMASHVAGDPLVKVQKMLKDFIARLAAEAEEETEHQSWCSSELSTNAHTRKEQTDQVETLQAEIDEIHASISKLQEQTEDIAQAIADLESAMAEAAKLRMPDKAKNEETVSDAQDAQAAVAQAVMVLEGLNAKSAVSPAAVPRPGIFTSPYKGMRSETTGVINMLQVIKSDFARLESETKAAEVSAQKDYDEFIEDSKADKSQKLLDVEHIRKKRKEESQELMQKNAALEAAHKDLDAALVYFEKLKPSCVESAFNYEDRAHRRQGEVESLQEALKILNGARPADVSAR